jgi:hypothetical protein
MEKQIEIYGIRSIIEAIESSKEISKVYLLKSDSHKVVCLGHLLFFLRERI